MPKAPPSGLRPPSPGPTAVLDPALRGKGLMGGLRHLPRFAGEGFGFAPPAQRGGAVAQRLRGALLLRFPRLRGKLPEGVKGAGAAIEVFRRGDAKSAPFRPPATLARPDGRARSRPAGEGIDGRPPAPSPLRRGRVMRCFAAWCRIAIWCFGCSCSRGFGVDSSAGTGTCANFLWRHK